jgi:hypothetical protein
MEEEREGEKNKWQNFSNKAFGKKGFVKKSIFKTPGNFLQVLSVMVLKVLLSGLQL